MDTSSIDLPVEIVELILSKCPVESVVRFKSVSKSWQSIISDPRFARTHHIQRSRLPENQNKFIFKDDSDYRFYFKRWEANGNFLTESVLENPFSGKRLLQLLSGCDGLFLLSTCNGEYILWNPSIAKHIIIPPSDNVPFNHFDMPFLYHLYFDSITNDYKIVFVYERSYAVYSCKKGIWGVREDWPGGLFPCLTVGVDGCIYSKCNGEIMCVDARDGKLHKFPQPNDVDGLVRFLRITDMCGRLCLHGVSEDHRRLHMWVMENNGRFEKSWRKLISMDKEEPDLWNPRPVCFTNEGVVLVRGQTSDYYKNWIYNPLLNGFQEVGLDHFRPDFPYSENLYMPPCSDIC